MKHCIVALALLLSFVANAAPVGDDFTLATASTQMSFRRDPSGAWLMTYYGPKFANAADAKALAWSGRYGRSDVDSFTPLTYTTFGASNNGGRSTGLAKFAGLCATHADGGVTTELLGEKAETVADVKGPELRGIHASALCSPQSFDFGALIPRERGHFSVAHELGGSAQPAQLCPLPFCGHAAAVGSKTQPFRQRKIQLRP